MRKNRASLKKRVAVAVVSVSAALPAAAPAASAFADEADGTADGAVSETEADGEAELAEEGADPGLTKITEVPTSENLNDGAADEDEADADVDADADADVIADGDLVDGDTDVDDEIISGDDDLETTDKLFSDYPAFGSEAFAEWFAGASDDEIEAWYDAAVLELAVDKATDSVPDREEAEVPEFGTEEFQAWAEEASDDEILNWMIGAGYDEARAFMDEFFAAAIKAEIPEFGPDFFGWLAAASEEDVKAWHEEHYLGAAEGYPTDLESEEFNTWFQEHCLVTVGDEEDPLTYYDYDAIFDWVCHVPFETAFKFLKELASGYGIMTMQAAGSLWPDGYGDKGDLYNHGNGTKDSPYTIDSVDDLRKFAVSIAKNERNTNDTYYLIKNGSYDLNGVWIPIGGALNSQGSNTEPTAFKGHLACEKGVVIENLGFKALEDPLKVTQTMASAIQAQSNVGFFALLGAGSSVTGLEIHTDSNTITSSSTAKYTGILAGEAVDATIKECIVKGNVKGDHGYVGGLIGYAHGANAGTGERGCVIENCQALDVTVYTENAAKNGFCNGHSAVGGLVGYAAHTTVLDTFVTTNGGSGNHIRGNDAYVGGIVGAARETDIINSCLWSGTVGSSNSYAVGGLLGGYGGGSLKVGRFAGSITAPTSGYNYSAAFMGAALDGIGFTYGEKGDVCYLYAKSSDLANKGVYGGRPADQGGAYGTDAHIGYWHPNDRGFTLVSGNVVKDSEDGDYFFEELERGIRECMKDENLQNIDTIDHFTCDKSGNPIRGYLLTLDLPLVDGKQAANVTAWIQGNAYRETCTPENQVAFAPGDVIYVNFTPLQGEDGYYQMDPTVANNPWYNYTQYMFDSGADTPTYFDVFSEQKKVGLAGMGDSRTFTMPNSDVTVEAKFRGSSQSVEIIPNHIFFKVVQERTGKREDPMVKYYVTAYTENPYLAGSASIVTDDKGTPWSNILIATRNPGEKTYKVEEDAKFQLASLVNKDKDQVRNLTWAVSNNPTLEAQAGNGLIPAETLKAAPTSNTTGPKATFMLDLTSEQTSAIAKQAKLLEDKQIGEQYKNPMTTASPYYYHSIITATDKERPADATNPAYGTLDVQFGFEVQDMTYVSLSGDMGVVLGKHDITYNVVRTLTGDRAHPTVRYTVNGETIAEKSELNAVFYPDYFTPDEEQGNGVKWYLSDNGIGDGYELNDTFENLQHKEVAGDADKPTKWSDGTITLEGTQDSDYKKIAVTLAGVTSDSVEDNVVLKQWVADQDATYTKLFKAVPDTTQTYRTLVKVTAHDMNSNTATDTCQVVVNFKTVDQTEIMPTNVDINGKENIHDYEIYYTFDGDKNSTITSRTITQKDGKNTSLVEGKGEQLSATISPEYDNTQTEFQPYEKGIKWYLAKADDDHSNLNPNDVLYIDPVTGQITVRGFSDSVNSKDLGYSPWIQSLISEGKLDGTTVKVKVIAQSVRDETVFDTHEIAVTFKAGTMTADKTEDGLTFDLVLTKKTATSLADTDVTAAEEWSGNDPQKVTASASGTAESPVFTVLKGDGETGEVDTDRLLLQSDTLEGIALMSMNADQYFKANTNAQWIKDVIRDRAEGNTGFQKVTIQAKTTNDTSKVTVPVTINFRYDGVDMTAAAVSELPEGYEASPDVITSDTPNETYDTKKGEVKDRQITMNVVATQGNYSVNNPGTRKWSYGIVDLGNTTYTSEGVKTDDAVYELSGDIKDYCKVDENGYLIPIKGKWDALIDTGETKGTVSGIITAKKEIDGKTMTDSFKVTINFRYDKAVLESHEETFDVVYTQDSQTNSVKAHWTGDDFIQLKAKITDESGRDVTPKWESSDPDIVTVDKDGRVYVNKDTWIQTIIDNAQKYGEQVHSGTRTVYVTAKHPTTGATADTCKITVNFRYDQEIHDKHTVTYNLIMTQKSRTNNPSVTWSGNDIRKLNANVFVEPGLNNKPYWSSEDAGIVTVDEAGNIEPVINAQWQLDIVNRGRFSGQKKVAIDSQNEAKTIKDSTNVTVNFQYENVVMSENAKTMDVVLTASGYSGSPSYTITGDKAAISAILNSAREGETKVVYSSSNAALVGINQDGSFSLTLPAGVTVDEKNNLVSNVKDKSVATLFAEGASPFLKEAMRHGYTTTNPYISSTTAVLTAASEDGRMADQCNLTIRVKYVDNTYSYSYSGGGSSSGGGGGGGGSTGGSGITTSGTTSRQTSSLPSYVLKGGTWVQNADGKWLYTNGRTFTNEWAALYNPYADTANGQSAFDWFHFGVDSFMTTGWFNDTDGYTYYLHPISDGTQGRMYTGWNWIDDDGDGVAECYYFETESNGHRGSLYRSTTTPDGYTVNAKGQWTQDGLVITKAVQ